MAKRIGKYRVSAKEDAIYQHDVTTATATTFKATDYVSALGGVYVGADSDPGTDNLVVDGTSTLTGIVTATAGVHNKNIVVQSGVAAENLTSTASDLIWIASTTQEGDITLPQATSGNAGMVIKIIAGADWSSTAFKLGFASGGSTVMFGDLDMSSHGSPTIDTVETFPITDNAKNLVIDANAVATAGGAKGSVYTFTYISANLVHCYGRGIVTTGTIATDATASVTGGI